MSGTIRSCWCRIFALHFGVGLALLAPAARGDDFSRILGPPLFDLAGRTAGRGASQLSVRAIESLPEVVRGERSAFVIVTTDRGNLAKLLVSPGLRRQGTAGDNRPLVPVLSLDRFETVASGDRVSWKARGRDIVLFDGFEFDLDTGQMVPPGFGGDVSYSSQGSGGPELRALGQNRLYAIDKPVAVPLSAPGRPSAGPAVVPDDFIGRYTLVSNGQTSGSLELVVAADGMVSGRFRSDRNGSVYPVTGRIPADLTRRIEFEIKFPRTRQVFDGLLWTEEKNVFAGTVQILEHPYSFVAVREGAALLPDSIDATSPPRAPAALKAKTRVIAMEAGSGRFTLDGTSRTAEELTASLSSSVKGQSATEVLLRVPPATSFEQVERAVRLVREAGVSTIRLSPATAD